MIYLLINIVVTTNHDCSIYSLHKVHNHIFLLAEGIMDPRGRHACDQSSQRNWKQMV